MCLYVVTGSRWSTLTRKVHKTGPRLDLNRDLGMKKKARITQRMTSNVLFTSGRAGRPVTWAGLHSLSGGYSTSKMWLIRATAATTATTVVPSGIIIFYFLFSLQKKFETLFGGKLEVCRTQQVCLRMTKKKSDEIKVHIYFCIII